MLNTVIANDVRHTLDQFRRSVDQMFDNFYGPAPAASTRTAAESNWAFSPVLESGWDQQGLNIRAILPGVAEQDLRVTLQNNQLILEGERKAPEGWEKNAYTQLAYGKFYAAITLPAGLDLEHMSCRLQQGILHMHVPMMEASKPKHIPIHIGEERKAIQ